MKSFYNFIQLLEVGEAAPPVPPSPVGGPMGAPPGGPMGAPPGGPMGADPMMGGVPGATPPVGGEVQTKNLQSLDAWSVIEDILKGKEIQDKKTLTQPATAPAAPVAPPMGGGIPPVPMGGGGMPPMGGAPMGAPMGNPPGGEMGGPYLQGTPGF